METKSLILPGPHIYNCQKCSKSIAVQTHAQAKFVSCSSCGAYYAIKSGELRFIKQLNLEGFDYCITPGTKGAIGGAIYVVTAACQRMDSIGAKWREYTIFNPIKGYLFLSEFDGHWILLNQLEKSLHFEPQEHNITFETFRYHIYSKYKSSLNFAVGEFPYNVEDGIRPEIIEFIDPPDMLTREYTPTELRWYSGRHIEAKEVGSIFNIPALPVQKGIGQIEPLPFSLDYDSILRLSVIALAVFFAVQLYFNYSCQDAVVFNYSNSITETTNNQPVTTPSFEIKGGTKNLVYHLSADIDNHWIETSVILVNDKTGESFDFAHGVEYYHGYEDGESWSEGDRGADKIIEAVPSGTYHLVINPEKEPYAPEVSYGIELHRDVPRWSNMLKAAIVILILPVIQFCRGRIFEKDRWSDSDYTPYKESE